MGRFGRSARTLRVERLEGRILLAAAAAVADVAAALPVSGPVVIQSETLTVPLNVNQLVADGKATVNAVTPYDIGGPSDIFDGNNATLARSANVNPAILEVTFSTPKTIREFRARFSHAASYRWKVDAASTAGGTYTEIVPWTSAVDSVDSVKRLAAPVTVQKLRFTGQRLVGDNYVHVVNWTMLADVTLTTLRLKPAGNQSLHQYESRRYTAEGVSADGTVIDLTSQATWSTTNEAVARVDATGLVRAEAIGSTNVVATFGTLAAQGGLTVQAPLQRDLDVTWIERTPRYNYDAAKNNPAPGDLVTFRGHIKNWDNVTPSADYRWLIDGNIMGGGTLTDLQPNEERVVTLQWPWQAGPHRVKLVVDPDALVPEFSEMNNSVEDRTDGLAVGFWVEQSLYDYFHQKQRNLNIGSNSWEDWAQRQMMKWNEHNASAVWAGITPSGVTDRVRVDKITVVPDGALPLNGGLAGNNPDSRDKTPDLVWGFPSSALNGTFYANTTSRDPGNPFYLEPSLRHEMGHARYQVDEYTWDVANNNDVTQVQITDPTTGQAVAGSVLMPWLAFDSVLYYNQSGGMMTGPWGNNIWSPHEAGALQRIAGRRAVAGNMNAPGNIGEFLNDLPLRNHFRFVDGAGNPLVGANVRWYAASPGPGYGGKTFDNTPEYTLTADANGEVLLPQNPFLPGQHKEAVIRVEQGGQIWYRFFEVADMNLEYWRGNRQDAHYTIELPLRTSLPEMDVMGLGTVSVADGDTTPTPDDGTHFGAADVFGTSAGLGAGDMPGYIIRTFAVKNRGGQPLRLTGSGTRVAIGGPNAADFSVVYQPGDNITSETITVFQIKFDPRAAGTRTATVTIANNDGDENPYNFTIQGTGILVGAEVPGSKFNDVNANSVRDAGEPPLQGWTIFADLDNDGLLDSNEPSAVSGADGTLTLGGLPTDRITNVREVQQAGWRQTYPAAGFYTFNPFIDAVQGPFDFGNTQKALVTGTVFDDRNRDGIVDPGEAGLPGQPLYVDLDHDSEKDPTEPTAVTDATGRYAFDLDAGTYTIVLEPNAGWVATQPETRLREVIVSAGQVMGGQDFGLERIVHNLVLFYNNSAFDGNDPAANAADDAAREVFKGALFPGFGLTGSFHNVSNYSKGINGIMIDVGDLPASPFGGLPLSAADFTFRVGNSNDPSMWAAAPVPAEVVVRDAGIPSSDRISITWADNAIRNTWLQVTMLANAHTGLAAPEVFYFGNLVGATQALRVNALDLAAVRRIMNTTAGIESPYDINRDGRINSLDLAAVRSNLFHTLEPIQPDLLRSPGGA
jgi:hypothetical protein